MNKIYTFLYLVLLLNSSVIFAANKVVAKEAEETFFLRVSSASFTQIDSVYKKKYIAIERLYKLKEYANALSNALLLFNSLKEKNDKNNLYEICLMVGDIYDKTNNHKRSLDFYKNSLEILHGNLNSDKIKNLNLSFPKTYLRIGSSFQKLSLNDSAKVYYDKLLHTANLNDETSLLKAITYTNLSGIYEQDSLFDLAKFYVKKSIKTYKSNKDKVNEANAVNSLGNIHLSMKEYEKAKKVYLSGIELIKYDNRQNAVRFKANLYYNLAWAMRNLEDYKAYDYQELSYEIEDGIRDQEITRIVEEATAKYNVDNVKREEENKRLKDQKTFWIFGVSSLLIMISLLYFLNIYKLKQKNLGLKLSQTQLLQNQNLEKLKSESQARILNATIDGKESERKGIIPIEIDKTQHIIAEASQKIRELSHTLVSSVLLKFGLNFAVKDMASKYSNSVLYIETDVTGLRRYHQNFEIKVYNIIQEFINNILKHSKANNAFVKMYEENNMVCFQISDDGIGFDKTIVTNKDGLGLNQIEARIQMMNGKFLIESTLDTILGEGTTISVKLPVVEKNKIIHV